MRHPGVIKEKTSTFHFAWIILITCFVNVFISYSARLGFGIIFPEMIVSLDLNRTAGGTIFNAYFFTYITLSPFTGLLTDRFGGRSVITVCCLFVALGTFLMGTTQNLFSACAYFAIVGIGASGMWTPVITVLQRWFAPHRRGLALGLLSTGYGLGFATMGVVFPWIVSYSSWRFGWYYLGIGAFVMVFINGILIRSSPEDIGLLPWGNNRHTTKIPSESSHSVAKENILQTVFKSRLFWIVGISYLLIAYSLYGITTFMVDYAKYQLGFALEKASFLATIHGFSQALGVLIIVPLSDYMTRKKTLTFSNTVLMCCMIGILLLGKYWGILIVLIGLLGLFYGSIWPLYGASAGDYFPRDVMGSVVGAWTPLYGLGAISVHWVTGIIRDSTGSYEYAFALCIVAAGLSALLMGLVKGVRRGSQSE